MAKLLVSPELLVLAMFGGLRPYPEIRIVGASFDHTNGGTVELTIEGREVPDCERVTATIHVERRTVEFKPA